MARTDVKTVHIDNGNVNVQTRFKRLFETSQWSDCKFLIDGDVFRVHRLVLATSSPVFEVMFYGPMAEEDTIQVKDMRPREFKQLLGYIYTDEVSLESVDNAWRLLYAAKKYLLPALGSICLEYIINNLSAANVLSSYELAEMYEEKRVQDRCIDMICKYTPLVLNCDYHMTASTLCTILDQNNLNASEWELVCSAISWAEDECMYRDLNPSVNNKRAVLVEAGALAKLRFLALPTHYFDLQTTLTEILTNGEMQNLRHIKEIPESTYFNSLNGFSKDRRQRFNVPLPYHTATRWILKGASVLRVNSANASVRTTIISNRRVLVYGFTVPTRLATRWITHCNNEETEKYTESFIVSIKDTRTNNNVVPDTLVKQIVSNSSSMMVKLTEPAILDNGISYQILIQWPFDNFDFNGHEYSLDCLSSYADRKGTRFVLSSDFDFIQSISYSPYSI